MARLRATKLSAIGSGRRRKLSAIAKQFADGTDGMWFQPSDLATMFQDSAGASPVTAMDQPLGRMSDKSGRGNHATQGTPTARGKISARVNYLTRTNDLTHSDWTQDWVTTAAIGGGAFKVVPSTDLRGDRRVRNTVSNNLTTTSRCAYRIKAKADGYGWLRLRVSAVAANFNLSAGAVGTVIAGGLAATASILAVEDGYYLCEMSFAGNGNIFYIYPYNADSATVDSTPFAGDGVSGIIVKEPSYLYEADKSTQYQYVNSLNDYATAGFPVYASTDGADDFYTTAGGGGATTAFTYAAKITVRKGGVAQVLWSDASGNTGYQVQVTAANTVEISAGIGASRVVLASAAITLNQAYAIVAKHDGTNLSVQLAGGTPVTAACGTATAGTASVTLFKTNSASSAFAAVDVRVLASMKNKAVTGADLVQLNNELMGI